MAWGGYCNGVVVGKRLFLKTSSWGFCVRPYGSPALTVWVGTPAVGEQGSNEAHGTAVHPAGSIARTGRLSVSSFGDTEDTDTFLRRKSVSRANLITPGQRPCCVRVLPEGRWYGASVKAHSTHLPTQSSPYRVGALLGRIAGHSLLTLVDGTECEAGEVHPQEEEAPSRSQLGSPTVVPALERHPQGC